MNPVKDQRWAMSPAKTRSTPPGSIKIYTNEVVGGWSPRDKMLGGSEECVVLLAEEFQRQGHEVTVYHTKKPGDGKFILNGVYYFERGAVECYPEDIFITFKDPSPWLNGLAGDARVKIHWSSDVEDMWDTSLVDYFVNLTEYHQRRNFFVREDRKCIIPHGIDTGSLASGPGRVPGLILYCSSPDRGLLTLLRDWSVIRSHYPRMLLNITYGFDIFDRVMGSRGAAFKQEILRLMNQPGVTFLGTLSRNELIEQYHEAEFWILPLQRPDSELFCLNAIKSRECGCTPVVNKKGALENTVGDFIDYSEFVGGNPILKKSNLPVPAISWAQIYENYWKKLI